MGRFSCSFPDCNNYVDYRISQKGNKIAEGSNCSGIMECFECYDHYCSIHITNHLKECKSNGYRNAADQ